MTWHVGPVGSPAQPSPLEDEMATLHWSAEAFRHDVEAFNRTAWTSEPLPWPQPRAHGSDPGVSEGHSEVMDLPSDSAQPA